MENQININEIEDIQYLKALAYDEVVILETRKRNLDMINNRIKEIQIHQSEVVTENETATDAESPVEDLNVEETINE